MDATRQGPRLLLTCALLLILTISSLGIGGVKAANESTRSVTIPIKVVLVGFDQSQVDLSYLSWAGSGRNLPTSVTNLDLSSGNSTGIFFHPQYSVSFAPQSFKTDLQNYLASIQKDKNGKNPWFYRFEQDDKNADYYNRVPQAVNYASYDANSVENWLWEHAGDLGGYPSNGWTIIVSYLPGLPSLSWSDYKEFERTFGQALPNSTRPHYYSASYTDSDLGYAFRYRDFMNAWGGHHRMWFVDLAAGPVWNSQWTDLPLQVVLGDNNIDLSSSFGKTWLTEYLSDYIWEATYNFITPNFVYAPRFSPNYHIDIFLFDDRTDDERKAVPLQNTVNREAVEAAFRDLVPYSTVIVNLNTLEMPQQLDMELKATYKYTDSFTMGDVFAEPERYGIVDLRPVYKYLLDNFNQYEPKPRISGDTITIPLFAFAFSEETYFSYTYKWFIGKRNLENGALLGIALDEVAFVSFNQHEFTRGDTVDPAQPGKGIGFTQTIIHELGHEFGLAHPHQYGDIGDFIYSPMGYFTNDYTFGQIDKDALQRAHADELYIQTLGLLDQLSSELAQQVRSKLSEVDQSYAAMDYVSAVKSAVEAYQMASGHTFSTENVPATTQSTSNPGGFPDIALVAGIVIGVAVGFLALGMMMKRRNVTKA